MRLILGLFALLAPALIWADEPALKESVSVSLVQIEVTVWPKNGEPDACLGLGKDDFDLTVGGRSRPIYAVDAVGEGETYTLPGPRSDDAPVPGGMAVVLLFDLYHLDLFYKGYSACPHGLGLAFREARRYLEEEFRDGDRLLLVTFGAWPVVQEGWIRTREEGLRALERLGNNRRVVGDTGRGHLHHGTWIAGLESLYLAMGHYPGRKDVILLCEDFNHDDVAMRIFEIAGRAQANGVVTSAVDLLSSCRSIPGPGCPGAPSGGLACTQWKVPVALNPLSRDTGGSLFRTESIASAVATLRANRKCRYLVSFMAPPIQKKRQQRVNLGLKRRDLSLAAPSAYEAPAWAATAVEREEALFLLPRFGRGLAAEAAIWPYRAATKAKKKKRWDVFAVARIDHTVDEAWPDELTEITVHVLLHRESKVHGSYKKQIVGEELAALRMPGGSRLLLFPFKDVPPGETTLDLTVTSNVGGIAANTRTDQAIPLLPGPGEAGPWFLSDQVVRLGDRAVMAPSLDGSLLPGEHAWMLGFACRRKGGGPASYQGELVSSSGATAVPVTLKWLPGLEANERACGWLLGPIAADLAPDLWRFAPPAELQPPVKGAMLEFTVDGAPGETSPASEVSPR